MAARKSRYSIAQLFIAIGICAFLVASFALPGGYLVHLPIFVALALTWALWRLIESQRKLPAKLSFRSHWKILAVTAMMLALAMLYLPMYGYLSERDHDLRLAARQREKVLNLSNPEKFRTIAQELQKNLLGRPEDHRLLLGSSADVPPEIAAIDPMLIVASENYLFIKVSPNGSGLVIYPEGSTFARVQGCVLIVPDVYFRNE